MLAEDAVAASAADCVDEACFEPLDSDGAVFAEGEFFVGVMLVKILEEHDLLPLGLFDGVLGEAAVAEEGGLVTVVALVGILIQKQRVGRLLLHSSHRLASYATPAFPVGLLVGEVDSPSRERPLLEDPTAAIELTLLNVIGKVVYCFAHIV